MIFYLFFLKAPNVYSQKEAKCILLYFNIIITHVDGIQIITVIAQKNYLLVYQAKYKILIGSVAFGASDQTKTGFWLVN